MLCRGEEKPLTAEIPAYNLTSEELELEFKTSNL